MLLVSFYTHRALYQFGSVKTISLSCHYGQDTYIQHGSFLATSSDHWCFNFSLGNKGIFVLKQNYRACYSILKRFGTHGLPTTLCKVEQKQECHSTLTNSWPSFSVALYQLFTLSQSLDSQTLNFMGGFLNKLPKMNWKIIRSCVATTQSPT